MRRKNFISVGLSVGFLLLALPGVADAQTASGVVVTEADGAPVDGASVALVDTAGAAAAVTSSDSLGAFSLTAPSAGRFRIVVQQPGFERFASRLVDLDARRRQQVRVELTVSPIPLPGIVVETEANRAARRELVYYGVRLNDLGSRFISPESVAKREMTARDVGDIVRWQAIPGVEVLNRSNSGGITPNLCVRLSRHPGTCALIVLNNVVIDAGSAALYPPNAVAWMAVLRPTEAVLAFGTRAADGALLIFTKGFR